VHISEIADLPFRHGILAHGTLERTAPFNKGLPVGTGDVLVRFSKGAGLPGRWPDFAGLAWRMDHGCSPWDVLMTSAGSSALGRVAPRPATSWSQATFSTVLPLGHGGQTRWLRARFISSLDEAGLSLATLSSHLRADSIEIAIDQSDGVGDFAALAVLTVTALLPESDQGPLALDPMLHSAPGVELLPGWLTAFRRGTRSESVDSRHM
jgi:hypothetical protein